MIRRFLSYYKPYKRELSLDLLVGVLGALCSLVYPIFSRTIINDFIPDGNLKMIFLFAGLLLLAYTFKCFFNYYLARYGHYLGVKMQADMRRDLFNHMERLPCSFFDKNKTGALMSRLTNDLFEVSELAHHGPEDVLTSAILLIGSFSMMASMSLPLALISFAPIPLMLFFAIKMRGNMSRAFTESREKISEINAGLENSISGIRVSKAYAAADEEEAGFAEANGRFVSVRKKAYNAMATYHAGLGFIGDLLYAVVLVAGGLFVLYQRIDYGDFVAFLLYVGVFLQPINKLVMFAEQFQDGMSGFRRFTEIMEETPEQDAADAKVLDPRTVKGELVFDGVSFSYGEGEILHHLNVNIPAGKTLALVGPSGGGKTTFCHLLPRFYELGEGCITLDGEDIRSYTLDSLRSSIGMVAQDVFLFHASIRENIAYGNPDATEEEIVAAAKAAGIHETIEAMKDGYDTVVGERGVRLSGGQKQRVSIARAFLKNPPILILDEATSALDNITEHMIQKSLAALTVGRTVIVVAHRLSTVKAADEILYMDAEGVKERGSHEELMQKGGLYAALATRTAELS